MKSKEIVINPKTSILEWLKIADNTDSNIFAISNNGNVSAYFTDVELRKLAVNKKNLNKKILDFINEKIHALQNSTDYNYTTETLQNLENNNQSLIVDIKDVPVVIMAGGLGTRLKPFTEIIPKPLFPIGEKAILEIIIERFKKYNIKNFYLTINYKAAFIKAFFNSIERDYNVYYVQENRPLGTAGSLKYLQDTFKLPFFVSNCDILINTNYKKIYHFHQKYNFDLTLVGAIQSFSIPYGVCKINNEDISLKEIAEKPKEFHIINTGMYILNPHVLKLIPKDTFFHITDLISEIKKHSGRVGVFPIAEDSWIDIGTLKEFKKNMAKLSLPPSIDKL